MNTAKNTMEQICAKCGEIFIFRCRENDTLPSCCQPCASAAAKERQKKLEEEHQRIENEKWEKQRIEDQKRFEAKIREYDTIALEEIPGDDAHTLYIIGNGFDLMHGVKSSYYSFRDSLGKNSSLRCKLETYLKPDDIWADFEEALAHFDMDAMAGHYHVDDMLQLSGAFDKDAGAAEYYMALEMAARPIMEVADELPKRFREWVEKLQIGTKDRPLRELIHNSRVLCFNYTEFVEELYGVSEENVCYIHGCRRKKKGHPKEELILGHMPGASDAEYELIRERKKKNSYRSQLVGIAQDEVIGFILQSDEALTKDSREIIKAKEGFFGGLSDVENIVVIGHSMSRVDWDYFLQTALCAPKAHWYIGCHGIRDLGNMERLVSALGISDQTTVFRTDTVSVTRIPEVVKPVVAPKRSKEKSVYSADGKWRAAWSGNRVDIVNEKAGDKLTRIFPVPVRSCAFSPAGDLVFVIVGGMDAGVPFFRLSGGVWKYVDEMESVPHQNLINRRLQHVFLTDQTITFVYNSRVRKYSLETGALVLNQARRDARNGTYEGEEISSLFVQNGR